MRRLLLSSLIALVLIVAPVRTLAAPSSVLLYGVNIWPNCGEWMPCYPELFLTPAFAIVGTVGFERVEHVPVSDYREYYFLAGNPAGARAVLSRAGDAWYWSLDHPEYGHAEGWAR